MTGSEKNFRLESSMPRKMILLLILALVMVSITSQASLFDSLNAQKPGQFAGFYKPIGEWAGQIILPPSGRRLENGSVPFLVFCSPQKELIGRILQLSWDPSAKAENWFYDLSVDVNFDPGTRAFGEKAGCRFPTILDGWKKVSPLESLAANRSEGTIEVVLKNPVLKGSTIFIAQEPAQVNGSLVCLAKFTGKAEGNLRKIAHYNPATRKFDGPEEIVTIMPRKAHKGEDAPNTSVELIEKSGMNTGGWYLYGKRLKNTFLVKALEPRLPLLVRPTVCISDVSSIRDYASKRVFDDLKPGIYRTTLCADDQSMSVNKQWPVGRKYLLMHLFGWRKLAAAKPGVMDLLNLVTGHFAFGFAQIVKDGFTGEPRWDIEYKQVYGHNREEVVSGSLKWHAYMGNLRRGWMYSIPVADTIFDIPELQPYKINGRTVDPMRGLARELEKMMAKYRVGSGSGCSMVRPDVSCVQDSHCALNSGLDLLINGLGKHPDVIAWQKAGSADAKRFQSLKELAREVEKTITSFGIKQGNWKEFIETPFGTRNPGKIRAIINSLKSVRTVFPRGAYDHLMTLSAKKNYPMWTILTCQIGGLIPGLVPQKPTSLIGHK